MRISLAALVLAALASAFFAGCSGRTVVNVGPGYHHKAVVVKKPVVRAPTIKVKKTVEYEIK